MSKEQPNKTEFFMALIKGRAVLPKPDAEQGLKDYHTAQAMKNAVRAKGVHAKVRAMRQAIASYRVWVQIGPGGFIELLDSDLHVLYRF